jgi:AmiR/NasT family two-component response regulator
MKAMLIADSDTSAGALVEMLRPYGFDVIRYRSAVKALDNICEIEPDAVFISAADFPRHWKVIAQFIRSYAERDRTIVVLLTNERFTAQDADKAIHIGVQAMIDESVRKGDDSERIAGIFSRYKPTADLRETFEYHDIGERASFLFTNPITETIITGKVEGVTKSEIMFRPDAPSATADLAVGDVLDQCSLKLDAEVIQAKCLVTRNGNVMHLDFQAMAEKDRLALERFISEAV